MLYDRFSFNRLLFVYLTSSYSSSSSRSFRSIRRALIIRIYENHDEGRSWPKVSSCIIQFIVGERGEKEVKKEKRKSESKNGKRKNMRSKGDISNKSGRRDANPFPSPPSHRSLLLSFLFSGACSPGNTRRHVKKTHEKDRIQLYHLPLYRYLSSIQAIVLKNRARRFAYNNVHCIFEQWEDPPRPHRHFHPLCHLICAFFKGKTKLPARLLMVASGKRSSSFDP